MAEKEGLNNKACQMSVGHSREGHFHEDGSLFTCVSVYIIDDT